MYLISVNLHIFLVVAAAAGFLVGSAGPVGAGGVSSVVVVVLSLFVE